MKRLCFIIGIAALAFAGLSQAQDFDLRPGLKGGGNTTPAPQVVAPPDAVAGKPQPYGAWGFAAVSSGLMIALVCYPSKESKE
jgi:hypothetical protein